ncbi:MAG: MBL fold metallo-hydrolase [Candidatus Aenigmarchaeota archaeon]|nr:MBL fold metallo-hydrolase [Candidatus Aenigmarchaeota archaeon]
MRLTVLNDNEAGNMFEAEHGLSFLVEDNGKKILFDAGPSNVFLRNAKKLGIDLGDIDFIVLSHGHWDHGNGLEFIKNKKLTCHPGCFIKRYRKKDNTYIGLPFTLEDAKKNFDLILSKEPYEISENIIFLGEIPRENNFEAKKTPFYKEGKEEDFVMDDSAIAIKSDNGLMIIAGCSHAGICNIIEYAKKTTGLKKVHAVIGGFHLRKVDELTNKTIEYFRKENIERIYPSHCVHPPVLEKFSEKLNAGRIKSGDIMEF